MSEEDYKESYRKEIDYWRIQYSNLQEEIERLNNIIKEVKEYIELGMNFDSLGVARTKRQLLEILNKEDNK